MFCPTYKDALSLLIEFAAICRAHGDIGILPGPFKASYKFLKVIGISKTLDLFSFIYPPLIFHSLHDIPSRTFLYDLYTNRLADSFISRCFFNEIKLSL